MEGTFVVVNSMPPSHGAESFDWFPFVKVWAAAGFLAPMVMFSQQAPFTNFSVFARKRCFLMPGKVFLLKSLPIPHFSSFLLPESVILGLHTFPLPFCGDFRL